MKLKMTTGCMSVMTCLALLENCLVHIVYFGSGNLKRSTIY